MPELAFPLQGKRERENLLADPRVGARKSGRATERLVFATIGATGTSMNSIFKQFTLVRDALLESMPNGDPQIFWSDPITWSQLQGASGLRLLATLFQATEDTTAVIIAQWGVDGKSWTDFVESLDGQSNPLTELTAEATQFAYQYSGLPEEFSGLVRIGVKVARSGSVQGRIRLSADILPLAKLAATMLTVAEDATVDSVTPTVETVGKVLVTNAYDRGTVYARTLGAYTAGDTTLFVQTSAYNSATYADTWRTIGTLAVFTATGQERALAVTGLDRYVRIVGYRSAAGSSILDVDMFVRPEA